jgi:hypothetical protein
MIFHYVSSRSIGTGYDGPERKLRTMSATALVLATVNAPHSKKLDAQTIAFCLTNHEAAKSNPGHMSSFFGDVKPELQIEFGGLFGIPPEQLASAAKAFAAYSGQSYPPAA